MKFIIVMIAFFSFFFLKADDYKKEIKFDTIYPQTIVDIAHKMFSHMIEYFQFYQNGEKSNVQYQKFLKLIFNKLIRLHAIILVLPKKNNDHRFSLLNDDLFYLINFLTQIKNILQQEFYDKTSRKLEIIYYLFDEARYRLQKIEK